MFVSTLRAHLPAPFLTFFITGAMGGYPSGALLSLSRDRAASDQGPGHRTVTYGVVAARRPPMSLNVQPSTYRNLCCLVVHDVTCQPGTLRIVMWRC